ncbi:MarR family transcriptional regulator [Actinoallomurus spadix]|uniref:MarR family transcriptional regulator n=1 Tax=Actinoallomurus spadix TaxID=79912 RepID=A0ABP3FJZ5_9ACTN|nr:MarR family transcriptional regulator [Actinoallomurus spadix]MCO5985965.1 MarR family transcriptional regulator [Actinoallomurus spadix]
MVERAIEPLEPGQVPDDDIDAVTSAVLTASRLLVGISLRSLTAVREQVTLPQFRLLVVLATHEETKLVTLADHLGVNPSTAMRMVERLVAAGLIDRRVNPASRREVLLRLTGDGSRVVDEVTARRREEIAAIVAAMPAEQRAGLVGALKAFTDAGGEPLVTETRAWD